MRVSLMNVLLMTNCPNWDPNTSMYPQMCDEIVESQEGAVICMNQPASEFFVWLVWFWEEQEGVFCVAPLKNPRNGQENIVQAPPSCCQTHEHEQSCQWDSGKYQSRKTVALIASDRMIPWDIQSPLQLEIVFDSFCCCYTNALTMCLVYLLWFSDPRQ